MPPCAPDISDDIPPPGGGGKEGDNNGDDDRFGIPTLEELGIEPPGKALKFKGGETEALARFESVMVIR